MNGWRIGIDDRGEEEERVEGKAKERNTWEVKKGRNKQGEG